MPEFTADLARALPGPAWLVDRRAAATERARARSMPSADEEIWRYSRIAELDLDTFTPAPVATTVSGQIVPRPVSDEGEVGIVMADAPDVFAELNDAFSSPILLKVRAGLILDEPVVVTHTVHADGVAVFPRLVVEAGADSEITVIERFVSTDVHSLVVPVVELKAHPAARIRYVGVNQLGPRVWSIGHQLADGDRDSTTLLASVVLGGDYARVRTDARLTGQGAHCDQIAVYFGEGSQMHDFRTLQHHVAPKTTSDLLFKGAVEGHAKSVYTGLIKIGKGARGSTAFQTNRTLKLSEGAWAESVPNLDIENNDVRCSHASAVGPVDEEQRFYLESRGVPPAVAERLIVLGFFAEVLDRLPVAGLSAELRDAVAAKLDRRDA
ncbi:MAG TPA: SufD family Fe-S cluster assembly protein [Acidimicrobiales bacterium]